PDHPETLRGAGNLALVEFKLGRYAEAVPLFERAVGGVAKRPELAPAGPLIPAGPGLAPVRAGRPARDEPHFPPGCAALPKQKTLSPANWNRLREVTAGLAEVYAQTNQQAKAVAWRVRMAKLPPEPAPPPRPAR